jgi:hypothetical protein
VSLERGVFTVSFDFELVFGSRDLVTDLGPLRAAARVTRERVFGPLVDAFVSRGMVATWATVGHLFLRGAARSGGALHPDVVPPTHAWRPDWLADVPDGDEQSAPEFYARSLVERLRDAGQEVGSHSFSHPVFGDPGCSAAVADSELARCVKEAAALGVTLRSFVFPRNIPGHVALLAKHGFTVWRPDETVWYRQPPVPAAVGRALHLVDVARAGAPPTVLPYRDDHGLVCLPASATFLPRDGVRRWIPLQRRVKRSIRGLDAAARARRVFHLYFHPINFATEPGPMLAALGQVLDHAARLRDAGKIEVRPMRDAPALLDALTSPPSSPRSARS